MRRLNGIDADLLYGETPTWHMHIGGLLVLDPSTAPDGLDFDAMRRTFAREVVRVPPLRERLVEVPFGVDRPVWVDDPHFDLDAHLHRIAVPPPGGPRELATLAGALEGMKLDRTRPLWEAWFIEGLEHGHVAVLAKIHHACADGVAGALLMGGILSTEPEPAPAELAPAPPGEPIPSAIRLLMGATGSFATLPLRAGRAVGRTAVSVGRLRARPSVDGDVPAARPFQAPRTSFNHPVSSARAIAFTSLSLADVKVVRRAFDATVNDVVLAVCGGALRRYLQARGELPDASLVAAVPVSVRTEDQLGSFGNMVSGWFAHLATDVADPVERLMMVRDAAASAKRVHETGIEDAVMDWAGLPAPAIWAAGVRLYAGAHLSERLPPVFNLLVSNVPGPQMPLYGGGARLVALYPLGPVLDTIGLNVTVLSYCGAVGFGILTCPELVPDPWQIVDGLHTELADLVEAASR